MTRNRVKTLWALVALAIGGLAFDAAAAGKPLKVYMLAGQSNMQGRCEFSTVEYMKRDPQTVPILEKMVNKDGTPRVIDNVWISTLGCDREEKSGKLTAGYGYGYGKADRIGPELTFGIYMQEFVREPILIIKTAWGGKSLCINFRPPSAGPYQVGKETREERLKRGDDVAGIKEKRREVSGQHYRLMMVGDGGHHRGHSGCHGWGENPRD